MKIFIFSSFLMMNIFTLFAQTKGIILDAYDTPINEVTIFFPDQNILIYSNNDGEFITKLDIPDNSYINFFKNGYSSKTLKYKSDSELMIVLDKLHINLDEIGVTESYNILGNNKLSSIEKKSLKDDFSSSSSMIENIAQLSGVDAISSGAGIQKLVVRGLSGMRVVTYLNGMKIENQQWANDHGLGFTDLGLYEVELIKGSSALQYGGEAVGGVIYFKDNPFVISEVLSGYIGSKFDNSNFLFRNQMGLKWSKNNFYINLHAQYSLASDYRLPNCKYLFNSRYRNRAIKFSIANRGNKMQNIFRYQYNGDEVGIPAHSHENLENVNIDDITNSSINFSQDFKVTRPTQFINNHLLIYENNYFLNKSKLSFHLGHFINNLKEYEKWTIPAFDMVLSNTQIRTNTRTNLDYFTFNIGAQAGIMKNENNTIERLIPDARTNDLGFYSTLDYERKQFGLSAGLRLDYKQIDSEEQDYDKLFSALSSSAGVYFKQQSHLLRLTYSGAFRAPHFAELFADGIHHGTNRYELGNTDLELEKGYQLDLKYQWSNDHFGLVINPFSHNIFDFISINPTDSLYDNTYKIFDYTQFNKVNLSGFEMNFHFHPHSIHSLHLEQSYSFIKTKNYDDNEVLALTPSNKIKTGVKFELEEYNLGLKFKTVSLYHLYSFAQEEIVDNETVTDAYNVLNIALSFKLFNQLNVVLGVNNLLNEEYTPHLSRVKEVAGGIPNPARSFTINLKYEF
jgi:iron complex outermembrane receptor protein